MRLEPASESRDPATIRVWRLWPWREQGSERPLGGAAGRRRDGMEQGIGRAPSEVETLLCYEVRRALQGPRCAAAGAGVEMGRSGVGRSDLQVGLEPL